MKRVFITGMSAVGKSTIGQRLAELGFKVVDIDYDGYSPVNECGEHHWDVDRIRELLATEDADVLFVLGADDAQVLFYPDFDYIILLSSPRDVMVQRLASRTNNPYGKDPRELAKILADLEQYEPAIRQAATHEIETTKPLDRVVDDILFVVQQEPPS
jgi:shikimate kinase